MISSRSKCYRIIFIALGFLQEMTIKLKVPYVINLIRLNFSRPRMYKNEMLVFQDLSKMELYLQIK